MKRYAVILLAILVSIVIVTSVLATIRRATEMPVRFNTRDFPEHGVLIVTPVDSSFNETVQKYFKTVLRTPFNRFLSLSRTRERSWCWVTR
jgi:uncharacterized protein YpmS